MSNFNYTNIDSILLATNPIRGSRTRLSSVRRKLVVPTLSDSEEQYFGRESSLELHVFLPNTTYVDNSSLYDVPFKIESRTERVTSGGVTETVTRKYVLIDVHDHIQNLLQLPPDNYKIVYNFFRNLIGGSTDENGRLFITDISQDRRELKLALKYPDNTAAKTDLTRFVLNYLSSTTYLPPIILNFGENLIVDIINVTSDGDDTYFYVKLYDSLPSEIDLYYECWLGSQILKPWIDNIVVRSQEPMDMIPYIKGPNFEVEYDYWINTETGYKSWNDLLSTNVQTSQEILNRYVNDTGSSVKLNVDYRDFSNFVVYSSAEDRTANFFYKLGLIETYNTQLLLLDTYTGSVSANIINVKNLRNKIEQGFDDFEKWVYYETTASNFYTSQSAAVITPYPKYQVDPTASDYHLLTKEGKYKLHSVLSDTGIDWYNNLVDAGLEYDLKNYNSLQKAIPEYILDDGQSEQFKTFVNMIGQHFDILYLYTDHILKKNTRKENPKDGLSQDLIYETAKNLGWTLSSGTQTKDLWEYALGLSGSGEPIWTGKTTINKYLSTSEENRTKEVWRRILNTLPYVYKSKGTSRSIKALLSAYGIPSTILSIREYGGPDNADFGEVPRAEWDKQTYYLGFLGSKQQPKTNQYVQVPWEKVNNANNQWQYPDTLTFRWKMHDAKYYPYHDNKVQTILQKQSGSRLDWYVTIANDGTDYDKGSLTFHMSGSNGYISASITDQYLYDDVPLNIMLQRRVSTDLTSSNQIYDLILKTGKYGKIVIEQSASIAISGSLSGSYNRAWSDNGQLYIGSGSNPQTNNILSGSIFELRYWSTILNTSSFDNHVLASRAYNSNNPTGSFYDLQGQWQFWKKFDSAATTSFISSHPDQTKKTFYSSSKSAYLNEFNSSSFDSFLETYNMEVATIANNTPFTEKVRIDSASLQDTLQFNKSVTVTEFDKYSIDSSKLMVAFSPQHIINEDIYESIGYTALDDYFGGYDSVNLEEYPDLKFLAKEYWKKYSNKNDFTAYIDLIARFDFSIFDQIRQVLPLRVNEILGLVVEPNILERSKVRTTRDFAVEKLDNVETNDISTLGSPALKLNKVKSTVTIGFDENYDSEFLEYGGEFEIGNTFETELQDINGEKDINYLTTSNLSKTSGSVFIPKKSFISEHNKLKTFLTGSKIKSFVANVKGIDASVNLKPAVSTKDIDGKTTFWYTPDIVGTISTIPIPSEYVNTTTTITPNETEQTTGTFDQINAPVKIGGHYQTPEPVYSTMEEYVNNQPSSYIFVDTDYVSPDDLRTAQQNYMFAGCKLEGNNGEGVNDIVYPAVTPGGGAIVEVLSTNILEDVPFVIE